MFCCFKWKFFQKLRTVEFLESKQSKIHFKILIIFFIFYKCKANFINIFSSLWWQRSWHLIIRVFSRTDRINMICVTYDYHKPYRIILRLIKRSIDSIKITGNTVKLKIKNQFFKIVHIIISRPRCWSIILIIFE